MEDQRSEEHEDEDNNGLEDSDSNQQSEELEGEDNGSPEKSDSFKQVEKLGRMATKLATIDLKKEQLIELHLIPFAKELISKRVLSANDAIQTCRRYFIIGLITKNNDISENEKGKWISLLEKSKRVIINSSIIISL